MVAAGGAGMPRFLVFSDVHANLTALEAVLGAAEGLWEWAMCLGDVVGYGPDPNEVIERMLRLNAVTIRGNHDKACSGAEYADFNPTAQAAVEWTFRQLRPEYRGWLRALPAGPVSNEDGYVFVHGSIEDEDKYLFSSEEAERSLELAPTPVTFFGHTHMQGGFLRENGHVEAFRPTYAAEENSVTLELDPAARYLINPGSVGQPRDGDPRAAFVLVDPERRAVEYRRIAYDIAAVQERMEQAGLPEPLVLRLAFGR
jgi:predicted phosphodiesterase